VDGFESDKSALSSLGKAAILLNETLTYIEGICLLSTF
jgi:hypothetical protein